MLCYYKTSSAIKKQTKSEARNAVHVKTNMNVMAVTQEFHALVLNVDYVCTNMVVSLR